MAQFDCGPEARNTTRRFRALDLIKRPNGYDRNIPGHAILDQPSVTKDETIVLVRFGLNSEVRGANKPYHL